jgi:ATP-binding cassette subfamily C protein LapB
MSINQLLWGFVKRYPALIFTNLFFTILSYLFEIIIVPRLLGRLFADQNDLRSVRKELIFLFVSWLLMQLCIMVSDYTYDTLYIRIDKYVVDQLYEKVLIRMDKQPDYENIVSVHTNIMSIKETTSLLLYYTVKILPRIITLIITSIYLCFLNKTIGSISLINVIFIIIIAIYNVIKQDEHRSKTQQKVLINQIDDTFNNINTVRSTMDGIDIELSKITTLSERCSDVEHNEILADRVSQWIVYGISILVAGLLLFILYTYRKNNSIDVEVFSSIILTIPSYVQQMNTIIFTIPKLSTHISSLKYYDSWIKEYYSHTKLEPSPAPTHSHINIDQLTFSYPDQEPMFTDWSVTLPTGLIWLKGESGSGKSTLIKMCMGLVQPTSGTIRLGDVPVTSSIKQHVVYLHQHAMTLFNTTLYNNIMYGNTHVTPEQLTQLLHRYQLFSVFGCEEGDKSFLQRSGGSSGEQLSGGQKQLVHLLRCVLLNKSFYIMDEPLTGLDPDTQTRVMRMITDLVQDGKTVYIISHDELSFPNQTILHFNKGQNPHLE